MDTIPAPHRAGPDAPFGALLRAWRQRRRRSQLDLALDAEVSQRHLSFVESGRASPSREMVLRLAATLDVPLRERNALLLAAGYAPVYPERPLDAPAMAAARRAASSSSVRATESSPRMASMVTRSPSRRSAMAGVGSGTRSRTITRRASSAARLELTTCLSWLLEEAGVVRKGLEYVIQRKQERGSDWDEEKGRERCGGMMCRGG